jgi:hypothetical protein
VISALRLVSSEARPLQVGDRVRPSAAWRVRYSDCWLGHWRSFGVDKAPRAWTGTVHALFTDRDGQRCAVVLHQLEDCGCNFKHDCWRCEGMGTTCRRALPLNELEAA